MSSHSPLRWFRKNQKWLIVIATAFLMFVFTLSVGSSGIDPLIDIFVDRSGQSNPVVVTWDGGSLRETDLIRLRQDRTNLRNLIGGVVSTVQERQGRPYAAPLMINTSDEGLLQLVLATRAAEEYGIEVSDENVLDYLDRLAGDGLVKRSEILSFWQNLTRGQGTEAQLLALLRRELASQNLNMLVFQGGSAPSPVRLWDLFNRLENRLEAELLPFPVDDFIAEVPEPTEAELTAFFNKYKDEYSFPFSATPGFRLRERMAFDYIGLNFDDFLDEELARVTDEQVAQFYEENKESFLDTSTRASDLEIDESMTDSPAAEPPAEPAESAAPESTEPESTEPAESDPTATEPSSPAAEQPMDEPAAAEAEEAAEPDGPAPSEVEADNADDADDPQAIDPSLTPVPQEGTEPTEPSGDQPSGDQPSGDQPSGDQPSGDGANGDEPSGDEPSGDEPSAGLSLAPAAPGMLDLSDPAEPEVKKYLPLDEVADEIRREIAAPEARKRMERATLMAQAKMDSYYGDYLAWEQSGQKEGKPAPPLPTFDDLESEGISLPVQSLPLGDRFEVAQMDGLGSAIDFQFDGQQVRQHAFVDVAFGNNLRLFQGQTFRGPTTYVYWVTDRKEAETPTFAQARDRVLQAWKIDQARGLAMAAAEKAADIARNSEGTLSDSLAEEGREFIRTGEISWMTGGSVDLAGGGRPRLGTIPGVNQAGQELMEGLFRLPPGGIGTFWNAPQTTVYVAKVLNTSPSLASRQDIFLTSALSTPGVVDLLAGQHQQMLNDWYQEYVRSLNVNWLREPRADNSRN